MRLRVLAVGRLKAGPERDLAERYRARAAASGRPLGLSGPEIVEVDEGRERRPVDRRRTELERLRRHLGASPLVVLDESAPSPTSIDVANRIGGWRDAGESAVAFAIGGADGLQHDFIVDAAWSLSFGRLTLPHGLVRVLLLEQLYRATTLLAGHPYHRSGGRD